MQPSNWVLALGLVGLAIVCSAATEPRLNNKPTIERIPINYTYVDHSSNAHYVSSSEISAQAFVRSNWFIDLFIPRHAIPERLFHVNFFTGNIETSRDAPSMMGKHYIGLIILLFMGTVIFIAFPCISLCLCLPCKKVSYQNLDGPRNEAIKNSRKKLLIRFNIVLAIVLLFILFGAYNSAASNEYLYSSGRNLLPALDDRVLDLMTFVNALSNDITSLLEVNFGELKNGLIDTLQQSGEIVSKQLAEFSNATSLLDLEKIATDLEDITTELKKINTITIDLQGYSSKLVTEFDSMKNRLNNALSQCSMNECVEIKEKLDKLKVGANFEELPVDQINKVFKKITDLLANNIVESVREGWAEFQRIQSDIQQTIDNELPKVIQKIDEAGLWVQDNCQKIDEYIHRTSQDITKMTTENVRTEEFNFYLKLAHNIGLAVVVILSVIFLFILVDFICDNLDKCSFKRIKNTPFRKLAIWLIILFSFPLWIVTSILMTGGIFSDRFICQTLKHPNESPILELMDQLITRNLMLETNGKIKWEGLPKVIESCHRNETLYNVAQLSNIMPTDKLQNLTSRFNIQKTIDELVEKIKLPQTSIINDEMIQKLESLKNSGLDGIDFESYIKILENGVTNFDLNHYAAEFRKIASMLPNLTEFENLKKELRNDADELEKYQEEIVKPMTESIHELNKTVIKLQERIKFNHNSMGEAIDDLIKQAKNAQEIITVDGPKFVVNLCSEIGNNIIYYIQSYANYVIDRILKDVGKCGPISNLYNSTTAAVCHKIADPMNSLWFSILLSLVFYIPTLFFVAAKYLE